MTIRYYSRITEPQNRYEGYWAFLTKTDNPSIIPRINETIMIDDVLYNVYDVCYVAEHKSDYINDVYINCIDILIDRSRVF